MEREGQWQNEKEGGGMEREGQWQNEREEKLVIERGKGVRKRARKRRGRLIKGEGGMKEGERVREKGIDR